MPFAKLPLPPGSLAAAPAPSRLSTKHTVRLSVGNDPARLALTHVHTSTVRLAVEYLSPPYPLLEIQCLQRYL